MEPAPIYLGLVKPVRFAGLPLGYLLMIGGLDYALLLLGRKLADVANGYMVFGVIGFIWIAGYVAARIAAEREPFFMDVIWTALTKTPRTRTHEALGADVYHA